MAAGLSVGMHHKKKMTHKFIILTEEIDRGDFFISSLFHVFFGYFCQIAENLKFIHNSFLK